jgi:intracellular septation protein
MRWGLFFIFLAILNEVIWRNFSTDFWVQFKVFGMMTISIIFTVAQVPFMMKEMKKIENSKA